MLKPMTVDQTAVICHPDCPERARITRPAIALECDCGARVVACALCWNAGRAEWCDFCAANHAHAEEGTQPAPLPELVAVRMGEHLDLGDLEAIQNHIDAGPEAPSRPFRQQTPLLSLDTMFAGLEATICLMQKAAGEGEFREIETPAGARECQRRLEKLRNTLAAYRAEL